MQPVMLLDGLEMRSIIPASQPQPCGGTVPDLQAEPAEAVTQKHNCVCVCLCVGVSVCVFGCVCCAQELSTQQQGLGKMLGSMAAGAHGQLVSVGG